MNQERVLDLPSWPVRSCGPWQLHMQVTLTFAGRGLHIGAGSDLAVHTDSPLLRDHRGVPILPASSIRGVLRNWCSREAAVCGVSQKTVFRLFGPDTGHLSQYDQQGRLTVISQPLEQVQTEIRDHIRLQPETETVADGGKFDQEVARVEQARFDVIYTGEGPDDPELHVLKALKLALQNGVLSFGAKTGIGLGHVAAAEIQTQVLDRSQEKGLAAFLQQRLNPAGGSTAHPFDWEQLKPVPARLRLAKEPCPLNWMQWHMQLSFEGPMLVGGVNRDANDPIDASYITRPDGRAYLPASALRGVLRSQARRILSGLKPPPPFADLLNLLFGEHSQELKGLLQVSEGELLGEPAALVLNHVAIDRISGFAAKQALYNARALASPVFEVTLRVFWRPDNVAEAAAVALLLFVLRDLEAGQLWLGRKTTAGYGHLKTLTPLKLQLSLLKANAQGVYRREKPSVYSNPGPVAQLAGLLKDTEILQAWEQACCAQTERGAS